MPEPIDLHRLRRVVRGEDASMPRREAMEQLARSTVEDRQIDFESVLRSEREDVRFRVLAAKQLQRIHTGAAERALVAGGATDDPTVLIGVMQALGSSGSAATLPFAEQVSQRTSGAAARQARFAAALLAHRFNLPGHAVAVPENSELLPVPSATMRSTPIVIATGTPEEVDAAVADVMDEPVGFPLVRGVGWKIQCGRFEWMLLFNEEFAAPERLAMLRVRKAVPALMASRARETGKYIASMTVLTDPGPAPDSVAVVVFTRAGRPAYAGLGKLAQDRLSLTFRTVRDGPAMPVLVEATYDGRGFSVETAISATSVPSGGREPRRVRPGTR